MRGDQLSRETVEMILQELPGERVTESSIKARIDKTEYLTHGLTTICVMTLDNGFKLVGHSTPASAENYRATIGEHYAYNNAFQEAWQLFGFLLVEAKYRRSLVPAPSVAPGDAGGGVLAPRVGEASSHG